jgi:hypothetical protein
VDDSGAAQFQQTVFLQEIVQGAADVGLFHGSVRSSRAYCHSAFQNRPLIGAQLKGSEFLLEMLGRGRLAIQEIQASA